MNPRALAPEKTEKAVALPARVATGRDREFLPAALEVLETPPPPLPVALMLVICAFFALALVWSFIGRLDVHAIAQGKIETVERPKVIQPLDPGKVLAIHVENGQHVNAGDVLVEFDPAEAAADEAAARDQRDASLAEIARRRFAIAEARAALTLLTKSNDPEAAKQSLSSLQAVATNIDPDIKWDADASDRFRSREIAVLIADFGQLVGGLQNFDKQMAEKQASITRLNMSIAFQRDLIGTLTDQVNTRQEAIDLKVGTKINLYDAKQQLQKSQSSLALDRGELIQTDAALNELTSEKAKLLAQFVADNQNKSEDAARKADEAKEAVAKAEARLARTKLVSPIEGIIQQIAVTTVGQVVTTGQQLMMVTPEKAPIQVEALVANMDIGFVRPGQNAVIKVDAFPFTRFGVLHGKVARIASEAIDEQEAKRALANTTAAANVANAPGPAMGQPQSFVFPVIVTLDENAMKIDGVRIALAAGMTVSVEIKTDSRRVIDYLLSPLAKVASEAMRER